MRKKPAYSMPDPRDRTDLARVKAMSEASIDYSDIPPLVAKPEKRDSAARAAVRPPSAKVEKPRRERARKRAGQGL